MQNTYSPKAFLRYAPKELLREYLESKDVHLTEEWQYLNAGKVDPIYDALWIHEGRLLIDIESDFRAIYSMANIAGMNAIIEEAGSTNSESNLIQKLQVMTDLYEISFWTFINHYDIFNVAQLLDSVQNLSFTKLLGLPNMEGDPDTESKDRLEGNLSAYYQQSEGRGNLCHIDYYTRGSKHFWFAFLSDYPQSRHVYDNQQLKVESHRPVFDVIFVYDVTDRTLDINAGRAKKRIPDLQQIFSRSILGYDVELTDNKKLVYKLNDLLNRDLTFPTDTEDGIDSVKVKMLKCSVFGTLNRTLTLNVAGKGGFQAIHDFLDDIVSSERFTKDILSVRQAAFQITFKPEKGNRRKKTLSFTVSHPNGCSLKHESKDNIVRNYLKKWGLDVSKHPFDNATVSRIAAQRVLHE